jgi:hypothetical protein
MRVEDSLSTLSDAVICPRCGYDQRGVMATWSESCPLQGTCSECGLELEWAPVLTNKFNMPRWCVERTERWFHIPWRSVTTLAHTFWPWSFWKLLKMTHEIRWRRIAAYLVVWLLVFYVLFASVQACVAWRDWAMWQGLWYSAGTNAISISQFDRTLHAFMLPFSAKSPGVVGPPLGPVPLTSPRELLSVYSTAAWLMGAPSYLISMMLMAAATFAVLPWSRRMAKVRWSHIFRVMLYGCAMPVPYVLLMGAAIYSAEWGYMMLLANVAGIVAGALVLLHLFWWTMAARHYLKMQHAWMVGLSVWIIAMLTSVIIVGALGAALDHLIG